MQKTRKQKVHGRQQSTLTSRPLQEVFKAQKKQEGRPRRKHTSDGRRAATPATGTKAYMIVKGVSNTQTMDVGEGQEDWWGKGRRRRQRVRWQD